MSNWWKNLFWRKIEVKTIQIKNERDLENTILGLSKYYSGLLLLAVSTLIKMTNILQSLLISSDEVYEKQLEL